MTGHMERIEALVSVVIVCRNVADLLEGCVNQVCRLLESSYTNYEVLIVDNQSDDETLAKAEALLSRYYCVRLLGLSRRVGTEIATMAGLESAIGDFVVSMEPDRDPPQHIERMLKLVREGQDIVIGVSDGTRHRRAFYRLLNDIYFALARRFIHMELIPGSTTFCALSRQAVNAMTRIRRRKRLFALVASETGFPMATYCYQQQPSARRRDRGLLASIRRGVSILINNSNVPLRFVSGVGLVGSLLCLLYGVYIFVINLVKETVTEGWTTLSLQVSGLFFLVFLMLALIGEYMARVLDESMERPLYHLRGEKASSVMISDATRRNVLEASVHETAAGTPLAQPEASREQ
jgi:polyisoprenyl-phosphate glycosyltransferase